MLRSACFVLARTARSVAKRPSPSPSSSFIVAPGPSSQGLSRSLWTRLPLQSVQTLPKLPTAFNTAVLGKDLSLRFASTSANPAQGSKITEADDSSGPKKLPGSVHTRPSSVTKSRQWKISPRKLNAVAIGLRRLNVEEALAQMQLSRKRIAHKITQVLVLAKANAVNNHQMDPAKLLIEECWIAKEMFLKRIRFAAKGRFGVMHHPYCRMHVRLIESEPDPKTGRVGRAGRKTPLAALEEFTEEEIAAQPKNPMTHRLRMNTTDPKFLHHWGKPADDHRSKVVFKNKPRTLTHASNTNSNTNNNATTAAQ